jgi:hypothetical protein
MSGARTVVRLEAEQAPEGGCAMTVMTFYHPLSYIIDCESERFRGWHGFCPRVWRPYYHLQKSPAGAGTSPNSSFTSDVRVYTYVHITTFCHALSRTSCHSHLSLFRSPNGERSIKRGFGLGAVGWVHTTLAYDSTAGVTFQS